MVKIYQTVSDNLKERANRPLYKLTEAPDVLNISNITDSFGTLPEGTYFLKSDVDGYVIQGNSSVVATTHCWPIFAFKEIGPYIVYDQSDGYFAGITTGATGKLFIKTAEEQ